MNNIEIMGVLNITDNSFHDGGKYNSFKESFQHAKEIIHEGADIIDIGAESSKPGSEPVSSKVQIKKIEPVVEAIREISDIPISIDTRSSDVIKKLTKYRINIVNDISALQDMELINVIKDNNLMVSLMHMQGFLKICKIILLMMMSSSDVYDYLEKKVQLCVNSGIDKSDIIIDPGFGFGKTLDHNYLLLNSLKKYTKLGCRILSGISRKSMIGSVINKPPSERLYGSLAATVLAIRNKASILRVHDVRQTRVLLNFKDLMIEKT
ncbi:MAG: dihydropteroate synthase [Ectothiorhodospiraceae bacterium]|nr:MAG: dihydropteroate synthase [Ectothiorhodospiraceae bacterium]